MGMHYGPSEVLAAQDGTGYVRIEVARGDTVYNSGSTKPGKEIHGPCLVEFWFAAGNVHQKDSVSPKMTLAALTETLREYSEVSAEEEPFDVPEAQEWRDRMADAGDQVARYAGQLMQMIATGKVVMTTEAGEPV